jgi:hypothetical protein
MRSSCALPHPDAGRFVDAQREPVALQREQDRVAADRVRYAPHLDSRPQPLVHEALRERVAALDPIDAGRGAPAQVG